MPLSPPLMGIMFPVDFAVFSVTVSLISGQSGGKHVLYVSLDVCIYLSYCVISASSIFLLVYVSANRPHSHRKESRARCIPRNAVRRGSAEPEVKLLSVWRREDRLFPQSCSHSCCLDSFRSTVLTVANPSVFVALKTLT